MKTSFKLLLHLYKSSFPFFIFSFLFPLVPVVFLSQINLMMENVPPTLFSSLILLSIFLLSIMENSSQVLSLPNPSLAFLYLHGVSIEKLFIAKTILSSILFLGRIFLFLFISSLYSLIPLENFFFLFSSIVVSLLIFSFSHLVNRFNSNALSSYLITLSVLYVLFEVPYLIFGEDIPFATFSLTRFYSTLLFSSPDLYSLSLFSIWAIILFVLVYLSYRFYVPRLHSS